MKGISLAASLMVIGALNAQAPVGNTPGANSRGTPPLSPYLNLLRGGNPAVNYYNGVQQGGAQSPFLGALNQGIGPRQSFFPTVDPLAEFIDEPRGKGLPPTGHPVGFNNTLNYFGPTSGQMFSRNAGQQRRR